MRRPEDKYKGSYEGCARIIRRYSTQPGLDLAELFIRIAVSFIIGNSDLHLKNLSLIEKTPGSRIFKLSDAYDILPVNVVEPRDLDQCALSLNGKKRGLAREDFLAFSGYCEIEPTAAEKILERIISMKSQYITTVQNSFLNHDQQVAVMELMSTRCKIL